MIDGGTTRYVGAADSWGDWFLVYKLGGLVKFIGCIEVYYFFIVLPDLLDTGIQNLYYSNWEE